MTVQFKTTHEISKFAKKLLYIGCCANALYSKFDKVTFHTHLNQLECETDLSVEDMENLLKENKIKFNWVSQW